MEMYLNKAAAKKGEEYQKFQRKKVSRAHCQIFCVRFDSLQIPVDKELRSSQVITLHVT